MASEKSRSGKPRTKRARPHKAKGDSEKQPHAAPETGGPVNFYSEDESPDAARHKSDANVTLIVRPPD